MGLNYIFLTPNQKLKSQNLKFIQHVHDFAIRISIILGISGL